MNLFASLYWLGHDDDDETTPFEFDAVLPDGSIEPPLSDDDTQPFEIITVRNYTPDTEAMLRAHKFEPSWVSDDGVTANWSRPKQSGGH